MDAIKNIMDKYLTWMSLPKFTKSDILEIFIIAFALYHIIIWVKNTKAWVIVKGIIVLLVFCLIASILHFNVILWIFKNAISAIIVAVVIVFQPELRKALEQLGRKNIVTSIFQFDEFRDKEDKFSDKVISEIVRATFELAKTKTGALMVIEQDILLTEYERTGIQIDSSISSQLLINIFEHNTPLHDGAVILKDNRIAAATCYLPLSDNMHLSKELGTRHRAGIGISEETDSVTIIVSEETGKVSIAEGGTLIRNINEDYLKAKLQDMQKKTTEVKGIKLWKGRRGNEKKSD